MKQKQLIQRTNHATQGYIHLWSFKEEVNSEYDLIKNTVAINRHGLAGRQQMYQHLSLEPVAVHISGHKQADDKTQVV